MEVLTSVQLVPGYVTHSKKGEFSRHTHWHVTADEAYGQRTLVRQLAGNGEQTSRHQYPIVKGN